MNLLVVLLKFLEARFEQERLVCPLQRLEQLLRLLKMIEWNEKAKHGLDYNTGCAGKRMQLWVSSETWSALDTCFAHFDRDDSWKALIASMELFSTLAKETAKKLGYTYLSDVDENITGFVKKLKSLKWNLD